MAVAKASQPGAAKWPWRYWTRQVLWAAVDLVFPPHCAGCGQPGQRFCDECRSKLSLLNPPFCQHCGYPVPKPDACPLCAAAGHAPQALSGIRSAVFLEGPLQKAVHQFKYRRDIILGDTLAGILLAANMLEAPAGSLVVPVPLAPDRLAARGYNQAGLLAQAFAERRGLRLAPSGALRVRSTSSQVGLSAQERRLNVAGAFAGEKRLVAGQSILLIDDVCTTGATLDSCAQALLAAGAIEVRGLSLARARRPSARSDRWPVEEVDAAAQTSSANW